MLRLSTQKIATRTTTKVCYAGPLSTLASSISSYYIQNAPFRRFSSGGGDGEGNPQDDNKSSRVFSAIVPTKGYGDEAPRMPRE
jgi:hypothetical protein